MGRRGAKTPSRLPASSHARRPRERCGCGKVWGRGADNLCGSRNSMHRNLRPAQENCLSSSAILRSFLRGSRERRPLDREPQIHLAVGRRREMREVERASLPIRRALRAMRPARHSEGRVEAGAPMPCPDHWATPFRLPGGGSGARPEARPSGLCLRLVFGATRGECAPSRARDRARTGRLRRPARTPQGMGASPSARRAREPAAAP